MRYENGQNKSEIIAGIILTIVVFIIFPIACSKHKSKPKYFDQMDGIEDPYWSP